MAADPGENVDLHATRSDRARELDEAMHAWLSTFTPYDTAGAGYSFRPPDNQTLDQLKTLGYMQ